MRIRAALGPAALRARTRWTRRPIIAMAAAAAAIVLFVGGAIVGGVLGGGTSLQQAAVADPGADRLVS